MTFAAQGKSLPVTLGAYRATVAGESGVIISIEGRTCFLRDDLARGLGHYLLAPSETGTKPVPITDGYSLQFGDG